MLSKHRVWGERLNRNDIFIRITRKKMKSIRIEMNRESGKCAHRKNNHGKSRQVPLFNPSGSFPLSLSLSLSASKLKINPVSHPSPLGAPPTSQASRYICVLTLMYHNSFPVLFNAVLVRIPVAKKSRGEAHRRHSRCDVPRFVKQRNDDR